MQPAKAPSASSDAEAALARRLGVRVLLAEDNALNQEVAVALLRQVGIEVDVANDGRDAVELVQHNHYDLVLMDLQMPVMDGLEATRRLRATPGYETIPIVAMTASAFETDRDACTAAGMNDHVPKPVVPNELYQVLLRWLPGSSGSAALAPAPRASPGAPEQGLDAEIVRERLRNVAGLDLEAGLRTLRGELSTYVRLLDSFCTRHDGDAAKLDDRLGASDREGARLVAHSLKGVAGNLGFRLLHALAGKIETSIVAGEPLETVLESTSVLAEELRRTVLDVRSSLPAVTAPPAAATVDRSALSHELRALRLLLADDDAQAAEVYGKVRTMVEATHGAVGKRLTREMEQFNFAEALGLLDELLLVTGGA